MSALSEDGEEGTEGEGGLLTPDIQGTSHIHVPEFSLQVPSLSLSPSPSLSFPLSPSPSPPPFSTQVQSEARLLAAQKEQVSISSFLNVSPALQNKHMQTTLATVEVVSVVRLQDFPTEHQPSILALGARYYIPTYRCYVCT